MTQHTRYVIVYRTGGTANFAWHRSLTYTDVTEAQQALETTRRMGYTAYLTDAHLSHSLGVPDTFDPADSVNAW